MKTIGLLGGMSWIATVPYYIRLNELIAEKLGNIHSARILLYSIDYERIKKHYHDGWDKIPALFAEEYMRLADAKPDCIMIACNTMHKAYDLAAPQFPKDIPCFHTVHLTKDYCLKHQVKRPLFVATQFTMTDHYFMQPLRDAGIDIVVPTDEEKKRIQEVQSEVSSGKVTEKQKAIFAEIISRYPNVDGVILACTELPLIAPPSTPGCPMINPAELQCQAAVAFVLETL